MTGLPRHRLQTRRRPRATPPEQPARERKAPAGNLRYWSTPPSARSTRCRISFDRGFHRPDETNPPQPDIVQRGRAPSHRSARPDRQKVVRFFSAYGDVVNRVSPQARAPSGECMRLACWLRRSAAMKFLWRQKLNSFEVKNPSSRWQNAIASTLQACAPRNHLRNKVSVASVNLTQLTL